MAFGNKSAAAAAAEGKITNAYFSGIEPGGYYTAPAYEAVAAGAIAVFHGGIANDEEYWLARLLKHYKGRAGNEKSQYYKVPVREDTNRGCVKDTNRGSGEDANRGSEIKAALVRVLTNRNADGFMHNLIFY